MEAKNPKQQPILIPLLGKQNSQTNRSQMCSGSRRKSKTIVNEFLKPKWIKHESASNGTTSQTRLNRLADLCVERIQDKEINKNGIDWISKNVRPKIKNVRACPQVQKFD